MLLPSSILLEEGVVRTSIDFGSFLIDILSLDKFEKILENVDRKSRAESTAKIVTVSSNYLFNCAPLPHKSLPKKQATEFEREVTGESGNFAGYTYLCDKYVMLYVSKVKTMGIISTSSF